MKAVLINPPLIDSLANLGSATTIPLGVTYIAGYLRDKGVDVSIVDGFGENPEQVKRFKKNYLQIGLTPSEIAERVGKADLAGISVMTAIGHNVSMEIIKEIRKRNPGIIIAVGGNHATFRHKNFLDNGADYVILGEGEIALHEIASGKDASKIDGIAYKENGKLMVNSKKSFIKNLDDLPYPARDLIPMENYWKFKQGQGAVSGKFTTIVSARGCPFSCTFCSSPEFWQKRWRPRSAKNFVDEIEYCISEFGIRDFHFGDDSFTTVKKRTIEICKEILKRNLKIKWSLPNGLRADTVDMETLKWMRKSGCSYFLVAPESGSKRVLKMMKKPVKLNHMRKIVRMANRLGISTGAFFVIGYPGEKIWDLMKTFGYVISLMRAGLDEFAMCSLTPLPGNTIGPEYELPDDFDDWENFWVSSGGSNKHRGKLYAFKVFVYLCFYLLQIVFHPRKFFRVFYNILASKQETKVDMILHRKLKVLSLKIDK